MKDKEVARFRELEQELNELAEEMNAKITEFAERLMNEPLTYEKAALLLKSFGWGCSIGSSKDFIVVRVTELVKSKAMQREIVSEKKASENIADEYKGRKITISMKNGTWEWSRKGLGYTKNRKELEKNE